MKDKEELKKEIAKSYEDSKVQVFKNIDLIYAWCDKRKTDRSHEDRAIYDYHGNDCVIHFEITSPVILVMPVSRLIDIGAGLGQPIELNLDKPLLISPPQP